MTRHHKKVKQCENFIEPTTISLGKTLWLLILFNFTQFVALAFCNSQCLSIFRASIDYPSLKFIELIFFPFVLFSAGYLGSFLSNSELWSKIETFVINKVYFRLPLVYLALKTNQLEVNTDVRTLRPIARLKEPRDLFALPKERDNECAQQLPRWPNECQVGRKTHLVFLWLFWHRGPFMKL